MPSLFRVRRTTRTPILAISLAAVLAVVTAAGCGTSSSSAPASSAACSPAKGKVNLSLWTWGAGYDKVVSLWNSTHPGIHVTLNSIPGGDQGGYAKMFNAAKAGTPPDLGFIEFDTLPAFRTQDDILNIAACLRGRNLSGFVPSIWSQVTLGMPGQAYAVPQNIGPMVLYYRRDLFRKYGIPVPSTWAQFAADAAKVKRVDKNAYLTNFQESPANWFASLAAQRGAQWFKYGGKSWDVTVNDADTQQVAAYWQHLISAGDVSTINSFTPEWNAQVARGHIWSWVSAAWGAGILKTAAPGLSGKWAVAQMPRWSTGTQSANWGGGGFAVFKGTKHPYEAAEFAYWIATDPSASKILKQSIGVYPTTRTLLGSPEFAKGDPYFGGQNIFDQLKLATGDLAPMTWGPSMSTSYAALSDAFGSALGSGAQGLPGALGPAEAAIKQDLHTQGIPVS